MADTYLNNMSLFFIPTLITILGLIFSKKVPKNRYGSVGYRTTRSRKSEATWEYSNKLAGKLWLILGLVTLAIAIIIRLIFGNLEQTCCIAVLVSELVIIIIPVFVIEGKLKEKFDEEGNPK